MVELKEKTNKCKGIQSDECKKARKDAKSKTAKFVDGSIEHIFRMLERAKNAAEKASVSDEERTELLDSIDAKLAEISALRQKIGQVQAQNTAEEIRNAAKSVREFWNSAKETVEVDNLKIKSSKLGGIIQKTEQLESKLADKLSAFKNEGKDTADLESKMSAFSEKLASAKSLNDELQSLLGNFASAEDKSAVMKEATEKMQQAHSELKEAHATLNAIRSTIRAQESLSAGVQ